MVPGATLARRHNMTSDINDPLTELDKLVKALAFNHGERIAKLEILINKELRLARNDIVGLANRIETHHPTGDNPGDYDADRFPNTGPPA